jgi:flagellar basal body P-ring formation protein FlgA
MTLFRRLFMTVALAAAPAVAAAQPFENLERLEVQIVASLGAGIGEPGGPARPIDRRLRLAACPTPPVVTMPYPASAAVHCEGIGWRIHVPLFRHAGAVAAVREAKPEPVIRKGDQVEVVADGGSFVVSTIAVAQQDGAAGDRIRLKGDAKAAPFFAEVTGPGRVAISRFK